MKYLKFLIIGVLFNSNSIMSQQLVSDIVPFDPFYGFYRLKRTNAISATTEFFVLNNDPIISKATYKRSSDGLNDTICGENGSTYISYYPDGKMKSYKNKLNSSNKYNTEYYYKYDENDRIKEISTPNHQIATYYYTNTGVDSISYYQYERFVDKWFYAGCELLEYSQCNEGYMIGDRYTYDDKDRLIKDIGESYEIYYTYNDSGYIKTLNQKYGPNFIIEYVFNKNEDLEKEIWWNEFRKSIDHAFIHRYTYPTTTANKEIKVLDRIYSTSNEIIIESQSSKNIMIYSINGYLIKRLRITGNITKIPMNSGLYIVSTDNKKQKVIVK